MAAKTDKQRRALARHSPLGLGQYHWPKKQIKHVAKNGRQEEQFYFRAYKTTQRVNKAILRLHDPDDPIDTLVVSQPRRTGKSQLASKFHPAWYLGNYPRRNLLITGYSSALCEDASAFARNVIRAHGQEVFGITVSDDSFAKDNWKIQDHGGMLRAAAIFGQLTGYGFNHITIDDVFKGYEDAHSEKIRRKIKAEIGSVVESGLEAPSTTFVIGTRWHTEDVSGEYIALAEGGDDRILYLNIPAIAEEDLYDEEGELFAKQGELLFPWQWWEEKIDRWRKKHGDYMYQALFQGKPTTPEGVFWQESLFETQWFSEWPECRYRLDTIDPAAGAEVTEGCDSAIVASCTNTGEKYFIDCDLAPSGPVQTVQRYEAFVDRTVKEGARFPDALGIEHNASQVQAMYDKLQEMMRRRNWSIPIFEIPIKRDLGEELGPTRDKNIKIQSLDPYIREGQYFFKKRSRGTAQLVAQFKYYGQGKQKVDGLDAMEMNAEFYSQLWQGDIRLE